MSVYECVLSSGEGAERGGVTTATEAQPGALPGGGKTGRREDCPEKTAVGSGHFLPKKVHCEHCQC